MDDMLIIMLVFAAVFLLGIILMVVVTQFTRDNAILGDLKYKRPNTLPHQAD